MAVTTEAPPRLRAEPSPEPTVPHRRSRLGGFGPAIASIVVSIVFTARTVMTVNGKPVFTLFDDAMISMRFARNLAHGHGLVWNAGQQPVEGYSNFGWTLVMAATHLLHLPDRLASLPVIVIGALLLLLEVHLVRALARELRPDSHLVEGAATWLVALYYPLIYWTLRGMEVGLEAVLLTAATLFAVRIARSADSTPATAWRLGLVLAAAVLVRDDIALPAAIIAAWAIWSSWPGRRRIAASAIGGPAVVVIAAHEIWRLAYYHALFPNTYYLKVSGVPLGVRVTRGLGAVGWLGIAHLGALVLLAVFYLGVRRRRVPTGTWLIVAVFVASIGYTVAVGGDAWEWMLYSDRFIAPLVPMLVILSVSGIEELVSRARASAWEPSVRRLGLVALGVFAITTVLLWSNALPAPGLQLSAVDPELHRRALLLFLLLVGVVVLVRVPQLARRRAAPAVFVALVWLATSGVAVSDWSHGNAAALPNDQQWAHIGLLLHDATQPNTTVAVTSAGNIAYFDQRPSIDILGKSDKYIAHLPPIYVDGYFLPGHSKRNYAYSVGQLRPDVVAQTFHPTAADLRHFKEWGYVKVLGMWVRAADPNVDVSLLRQGIDAMR